MRVERRLGAMLAAGACAALACSSSGGGQARPPAPASVSPSTSSPAAELRAHVDDLLGEHLILLGKATGAVAAGRPDLYPAYADQLAQNRDELAGVVELAYGPEARLGFANLWAAQDSHVADYAFALAGGDRARQELAAAKLTGTDLSLSADFWSGLTGLARTTLVDLLGKQLLGARQLVDDRGARSWTLFYADLRRVYAQAGLLGDALVETAVKHDPTRFPGDPDSRPSALRAGLNRLLQEHAYLTTLTTDAATAGRPDEFSAAAKALDDNGHDLGASLGAALGSSIEARFDHVWSAQDGLFVDYTSGVIGEDRGRQDRAADSLVNNAAPELADLLSGATGLAAPTLVDLARAHVLTIKDVIDAQAARDAPGTAARDRTAALHMRKIADPLAAAVVAKAASKFS